MWDTSNVFTHLGTAAKYAVVAFEMRTRKDSFLHKMPAILSFSVIRAAKIFDSIEDSINVCSKNRSEVDETIFIDILFQVYVYRVFVHRVIGPTAMRESIAVLAMSDGN